MANYGLSDPYIFNYGTEVKTFAELRVPNTSITWEVANQANIGFDARFLKDKASLSFDYFHNERDKILYWRNASVPATTGISLPRENIGKVVNRGFEFQIGYNNKAGDFTYSVSANGAYSKNKIKFWDETPGVPEYQKSTGHPMGSACYYQAIGIFKDQAAIDAYPHWGTARPGDIIFKDVNDDKVIDGLDAVRDDRSNLPTFTGGFNVDLGYKKFYAALFFQGAAGAMQQHVTESGLFGNFLQDDANGRWTPDNTDAKKPRAWDTFNEYWRSNMNTYWLRSTDYLRLKTVQIGYNMPSSINAKLGVKALRIYVSGQNLFTMTKLKDFDPEWGGYTYMGYPPLKVYNLGVSLTF